jgi:hypothetical protein
MFCFYLYCRYNFVESWFSSKLWKAGVLSSVGLSSVCVSIALKIDATAAFLKSEREFPSRFRGRDESSV